MAESYKKLPSEIIHIDDEYTAFCFDEACSYIVSKIREDPENPQEPQFKQEAKKYRSASDMYKNLGL